MNAQKNLLAILIVAACAANAFAQNLPQFPQLPLQFIPQELQAPLVELQNDYKTMKSMKIFNQPANQEIIIQDIIDVFEALKTTNFYKNAPPATQAHIDSIGVQLDQYKTSGTITIPQIMQMVNTFVSSAISSMTAGLGNLFGGMSGAKKPVMPIKI